MKYGIPKSNHQNTVKKIGKYRIPPHRRPSPKLYLSYKFNRVQKHYWTFYSQISFFSCKTKILYSFVGVFELLRMLLFVNALVDFHICKSYQHSISTYIIEQNLFVDCCKHKRLPGE